MPQAIITKFVPATNTKPSRVKATAEAGSVTLSWDHGLDADQNHAKAAKALCAKFGWKGSYYNGGTKEFYAWVYVDMARARFDSDFFVSL